MGQGSGVAVSCGVGRRHGSDPMLLWLWCKTAATAPIGPLAQEPWAPPLRSSSPLAMADEGTGSGWGALVPGAGPQLTRSLNFIVQHLNTCHSSKILSSSTFGSSRRGSAVNEPNKQP